MKKIITFTENNRVCECCGRKNLKGTYLIHDTDLGTEEYFGSECARKAMKLDNVSFKKASSTQQMIENIQSEAWENLNKRYFGCFFTFAQLSVETQEMIKKYKLRLERCSPYWNKETQASFQ